MDQCLFRTIRGGYNLTRTTIIDVLVNYTLLSAQNTMKTVLVSHNCFVYFEETSIPDEQVLTSGHIY